MRIRNELLERWLARLAVLSAKVLFATVRKRFHFASPETSPYIPATDSTFIYSVWHDSLLMPLFLGRQASTMALVGRHTDGTFLANSLAALNIPCVRGSSSRGGSLAVRQLLEQSASRHIVLTPDGPRGPRRQMKSGVAFLASRTGKAVVPTAFACRKAWHMGRGWTQLSIPKPFTTVFALTGAAIGIPADADSAALDQYTELIQSRMDQLNTEAHDMTNKFMRGADSMEASVS